MPNLTLPVSELLTPISATQPAGEDIRSSEDWVRIKAARPDTADTGGQGLWTPAEPSKASWESLRQLTADALGRKTKDLRIALLLLESNVRLNGFAGLRDGLYVIREILLHFWDTGLYPLVPDGDLEMRSGPLEWLNEKLADVIREIPLTKRSEPGQDYSFAYYQESRRPQGRIPAVEFDTAMRQTKSALIEDLYSDLLQAQAELSNLDQVCAAKFGAVAPSFHESREILDQIRVVLERVLPSKAAAPSSPGKAAPENGKTGSEPAGIRGLEFSSANGSSWEAAELLARSGQVNEALAEMTRLSATEGTGRARFHRKLMLADMCLATGRNQLAKVILEELADLIDKHQLEMWETSEVVGGVWTRLYGCYRDEKGGTADSGKAAALFLRLCRLNPWQALYCSDGQN